MAPSGLVYGNLGCPTWNPALLTPYFMGIGFATTKIPLNMGSSLICSLAAPSKLPSTSILIIVLICIPTRCDATLITPYPPRHKTWNVSASFPLQTRKPDLAFPIIEAIFSKSPLASFIPTMFGISLKRMVVSADREVIVRLGTL